VYNVGTGNSVTVLELVSALNEIFGTKLDAIPSEPRAGDVRFSKADISRTKADLGYEPKMGLKEGLRKTVEWYKTL
jgi:UDP-glucose 4-epimerase